MKTKKGIAVVILSVFLLVGMGSSLPASEGSGGVWLGNVVGGALSTVLKGVITGNVDNLGDALRMVLYGGVSGYGFYTAKEMVSSGHITSGYLLANLSSSVSMNVSRGDHPLGVIGYSIGPVRLGVATPFSRRSRGVLNVEVSAREVLNLAYSISNADRVRFRHGVLSFESDSMLQGIALGWTKGIYPTVVAGSDEMVMGHEMVHVIQGMQLSAASFYEPFMKEGRGGDRGPDRLFHFSGVRLDLLSLANDLASEAVSYEDRWQEQEAYYFSGRR